MKKHIILLSIFLFNLGACKTDKKSENKPTQTQTTINVEKADSKDKQLNITFLLDLSDRIEPSKYPNTPEHWERDIAVVNEFVQIFKKDMEKRGGYKAKGKMKVLFSPAPKDVDINEIAEKLEINLEAMKTTGKKKKVYDNLEQDFTENLKKIYTKTLETKKYIGSDIWRFFKNDVKDLVIDTNPNYRNILVVITDGYLYHKNTKMKEKNRYSYLLPKQIKNTGLTNSKWKERIEKLDFGLIVPRKDLNNLEVLMLELNPSKKSSPYEEDVMKSVLSKWFTEMGVQKFKIHKTALPNTTKTKIENFLVK